MALVDCPECANGVSDLATTCPKCGYPLQKMEYAFVEVCPIQTFNGVRFHGEDELKELLRNGWQIINQNEVADYDSNGGLPIIQYKLQRLVRNGY
jgi:hypothetical protein